MNGVFSKRLKQDVIITFLLSVLLLISMIGLADLEIAGSETNDYSVPYPYSLAPRWVLCAANDYNVAIIAKAASLYYYSNNSIPPDISVLVSQGFIESIPIQPFNPDSYYSIQSYEKNLVIIPGKCVDNRPLITGSIYKYY